jgi:hypothetical protein
MLIPTATRTTGNSSATGTTNVTTALLYISYYDYFVGFFLPTMVSTLIRIPIRILDMNVKLFQPWHELTRPGGASGRDSVCTKTGGWKAIVAGIRSLSRGQPLVFLSTLLTLFSGLLVALASQAVVLEPTGNCNPTSGSRSECTYALAVFSQPAKAALILLGVMILILITTILVLFKWRTGLSTNPWSILATAGLAGNDNFRELLIMAAAGPTAVDSMMKDLKSRKFQLSWFCNDKYNAEYGVTLCKPREEPYRLSALVHYSSVGSEPLSKTKQHIPFRILTHTGRLFLLFFPFYYSHYYSLL